MVRIFLTSENTPYFGETSCASQMLDFTLQTTPELYLATAVEFLFKNKMFILDK